MENGKAFSFPDIDTLVIGNGIYVSNNDVYFAGNRLSKGTYWKNGNAIPLEADNKVCSCRAVSIYGNNGDIYVAGNQDGASPYPIARYWKNGILYRVGNSMSFATSLWVTDTTVHVAGWFESKAGAYPTYSANQNNIGMLPYNNAHRNDYDYAHATSIAVAGSDIYIKGHVSNYRAGSRDIFWKNGIEIAIDNSISISSNSHALFGYDNDIYAVGSILNEQNKRVPAYMRNNEVKTLGTNTEAAVAYSIFVVK